MLEWIQLQLAFAENEENKGEISVGSFKAIVKKKNSSDSRFLATRFFGVIGLSLALVTAFSLVGFAGVSVTPLLLDLTVDPGGSGTGTLTVQNTGTEAIRIDAQVQGFKTTNKGVAKFLSESKADEYPYSGEKLLSLKPDGVVLEPNESRDFTYEVEYPKDVEPFGGRYVGALFLSSPVKEEEKASKGSEIKVATRVGTLILIRPSEEILVGEEFREFDVDPEIDKLTTRTVYDGDRLLVSTYLKNSGNIHIREEEFTGRILIKNPSGELVDEMDISPHNVLPDTEYALTELWKIPKEIKEDGPKTYSVTVKIEVKTPYGNVVNVQKSEEVEI